jgi:hypothetical protein
MSRVGQLTEGAAVRSLPAVRGDGVALARPIAVAGFVTGVAAALLIPARRFTGLLLAGIVGGRLGRRRR